MEDRFCIEAEYFLIIDGCRRDIGEEIDIRLTDGTEIKGAVLSDISSTDFSIEVLDQEIEIDIDKIKEIS